jgi:hypothetical protein
VVIPAAGASRPGAAKALGSISTAIRASIAPAAKAKENGSRPEIASTAK